MSFFLFFFAIQLNAMKKIIIPITLILCALVVTNCSPKVVNPSAQNDGEVVLPCQEERRATKDHFVGFGNSTSSDVGRALDKAAALARNDIAVSISADLSSLMEFYDESYERDGASQESARTEGFIQQFAQQTIQGTEVTCEKVYKESGSQGTKYSAYVVVQLSATDLITDYHKALSEADILEIDENAEDFRSKFEQMKLGK